jgi:predicted exporter
MMSRRARILALWLIAIAAAIAIVAHANYVTDLSAFLPSKPTPMQRVLVDQLRDGPASRLILVALENGDTAARAALSTSMAHRLRANPRFTSVDNGEPLTAELDRDFLFRHRYLLSDQVSAGRFSTPGLRAAVGETIENLATSSGLMLKSLVPHDPTGETLHNIDQLAHAQGPRTLDGVWLSADGARTLLVAQTTAAGSDTDGQELALDAIRSAFAAAVPAASRIQLRLSGPGVFAVAARAKIKRAAMRLSIISSILVVCVLLAVYRSLVALALGLLPVATGALAGIAAVALGFGVVHGITLGFGITLIGESVDYSIYFFVQSLRRNADTATWQRTLWPTVRLGMLTSVCGFASLLPSGFPGLAQLGLYSISGLLAAALVTRFVLPQCMPRGFTIRDVAPLGVRLRRWRDAGRHVGDRRIAMAAFALAVLALSILYLHRGTLWNRELSSLSPISIQEQRYDAELRSDLGAADVLDLVIVSGPTLEAVLRGAERAGGALQSLIDAQVISDYDSPTNYLPSLAAQRARRDALPDERALRDSVRQATAGTALEDAELAPFVDEVEAARGGALLTAEDLRGTSLAAGFGALVLHQSDHWSALLPLHAPATKAAAPAMPDVDLARVDAALTAANLSNTQVLDLKGQTDALYAGYLHEAMRLSLAGFVLIVLLLCITLRSISRVVRVLAPLALAVLIVAATLAGLGQQLTILHLVGMLLIVAVGSNYALFFDHEGSQEPGAGPLTLASLAVANVSTVIGFGLLSFSQVPVLEALGTTVAPGAFLALLLSALLTSRAPEGFDRA